VLHIHDRLGEGLRRFLRQVVADSTLDRSVCVLPGKFPGVRSRLRVWLTIGITFERDGGHGDARSRGPALFELIVLRFPLGQPESPAVVMNDDADVIRIVEGGGAAREYGLIEGPLR